MLGRNAHPVTSFDRELNLVKAEQAIEGRKMSQSETGERRITLGLKKVPAKKTTVKGHEAFLKALETSGASIRLEKISSGATMIGQVRHSDKFTVTIRVDGKDRVVFKHDISEFEAIPRREQEVAANDE